MSSIKKEVDRLFRQLHAKRGDNCRNPVTGAAFVWAVDSITEQKSSACRARVAQERHKDFSPGAPPLVVDAYEIAEMKSGGGEMHLFGYFCQSISSRDYRVLGHPQWEIYAGGVLASSRAPDFLKQDARLIGRFPPRPIYGLGPGLVWKSATVAEVRARVAGEKGHHVIS
jgi:hypothetical protein